MRILYVTANPFLRSTTSSLNAILEQLRPRGLQPVMLFQEPGPWQQQLAAEGVPCYFDPLRVPDKLRPLRTFRDIYRLVRLLRRERIDLIHCNEHEHYLALRLAARWTRLPVVTTLHFIINSGFAHWAFRPPYQPAALQFISRAQLDRCRPALPLSLGADRIKLLMSGLAIDDFLARDNGVSYRDQWALEPGAVVLGTASAIRAYKRLEDFVRLVGRLRARRLNVVGIIAGGGRFADPAYLNDLNRLIEQQGLTQHCRLVGNLDPITPFLKAIDIFVSTSEWETFGMSICEAMACGKPTLAYAVGGNPEALPDPWCAVPLGDLDSLEEKVAQVVSNPDLRRNLGAAAARHVRDHFDAPMLAARQAAIYEEVLGRPLGGVTSSGASQEVGVPV